jgi:hypothetical protein
MALFPVQEPWGKGGPDSFFLWLFLAQDLGDFFSHVILTLFSFCWLLLGFEALEIRIKKNLLV